MTTQPPTPPDDRLVTADQVPTLLGAYRDQGLTPLQCARRFGVSYGAICDALAINGITPDHGPALGGDQEPALISAYRDEGLSLDGCAERFGVGIAVVRYLLRKHGVAVRAPGTARVWPGHATVSEAADRLDVSDMTVYRLIHNGTLPAAPDGALQIPTPALSAYLAERDS